MHAMVLCNLITKYFAHNAEENTFLHCLHAKSFPSICAQVHCMYVHPNMCGGVRVAQQLWTSFTLCCKGILFTATADLLYLELNLKIKKCLYKPLCSSAESPHQRGIYGQGESDALKIDWKWQNVLKFGGIVSVS